MFDETLFINEISKIEKKDDGSYIAVSYTHLRAHETDS